MKNLFLTATIVLLLTACTAAHETSYVDSEFGQATRGAFDQQVVFPDNPHAGNIPEDLQGISAEELMNTYNSSYSKAPEKAEIFTLGFTGFTD